MTLVEVSLKWSTVDELRQALREAAGANSHVISLPDDAIADLDDALGVLGSNPNPYTPPLTFTPCGTNNPPDTPAPGFDRGDIPADGWPDFFAFSVWCNQASNQNTDIYLDGSVVHTGFGPKSANSPLLFVTRNGRIVPK